MRYTPLEIGLKYDRVYRAGDIVKKIQAIVAHNAAGAAGGPIGSGFKGSSGWGRRKRKAEAQGGLQAVHHPLPGITRMCEDEGIYTASATAPSQPPPPSIILFLADIPHSQPLAIQLSRTHLHPFIQLFNPFFPFSQSQPRSPLPSQPSILSCINPLLLAHHHHHHHPQHFTTPGTRAPKTTSLYKPDNRVSNFHSSYFRPPPPPPPLTTISPPPLR